MDLLGHFYFLAIMSNALNIRVHVSMWTYVFIFLGCIPRSGIVRSYGKSVFNLLKNCQIFFQHGRTIFHPPVGYLKKFEPHTQEIFNHVPLTVVMGLPGPCQPFPRNESLL